MSIFILVFSKYSAYASSKSPRSESQRGVIQKSVDGIQTKATSFVFVNQYDINVPKTPTIDRHNKDDQFINSGSSSRRKRSIFDSKQKYAYYRIPSSSQISSSPPFPLSSSSPSTSSNNINFVIDKSDVNGVWAAPKDLFLPSGPTTSLQPSDGLYFSNTRYLDDRENYSTAYHNHLETKNERRKFDNGKNEGDYNRDGNADDLSGKPKSIDEFIRQPPLRDIQFQSELYVGDQGISSAISSRSREPWIQLMNNGKDINGDVNNMDDHDMDNNVHLSKRNGLDRTWPNSEAMVAELSKAGQSMAKEFMMAKRTQRSGRRYDVPQIECPRSSDRMERFACPTPDFRGRYRCIDDRALCDGFFDCPGREDETPDQCLFYKTTKAHLDILAEALLRWARGKK